LALSAGAAEQMQLKNAKSNEVKWSSDDPKVAQIFQNGFVIALRAGSTKVRAQQSASTAECIVNVTESNSPLIDPATLQQYDDNRVFHINGRKCDGRELNDK